MNFSDYASMFERTLTQMGIDPSTCRSNNPNEWVLQRGSARVIAFLRTSTDHTGELGVLVIISPIMAVPTDKDKQSELAKTLLSFNHSFINERFTYAEGWIYLMTARALEGLSEGEIATMVDSLSYWADVSDDKLKAQFGDASNDINGGR